MLTVGERTRLSTFGKMASTIMLMMSMFTRENCVSAYGMSKAMAQYTMHRVARYMARRILNALLATMRRLKRAVGGSDVLMDQAGEHPSLHSATRCPTC